MQSLNIDQVEENFKVWRKQKRHKSEPIPVEFISQIRTLSGEYSRGVLIQRLGLSSSKLSQILGKKSQKAVTKKTTLNSPTFIPINSVKKEPAKIEFSIPGGLVIKVYA